METVSLRTNDFRISKRNKLAVLRELKANIDGRWFGNASTSTDDQQLCLEAAKKSRTLETFFQAFEFKTKTDHTGAIIEVVAPNLTTVSHEWEEIAKTLANCLSGYVYPGGRLNFSDKKGVILSYRSILEKESGKTRLIEEKIIRSFLITTGEKSGICFGYAGTNLPDFFQTCPKIPPCNILVDEVSQPAIPIVKENRAGDLVVVIPASVNSSLLGAYILTDDVMVLVFLDFESTVRNDLMTSPSQVVHKIEAITNFRWFCKKEMNWVGVDVADSQVARAIVALKNLRALG